MKTGFTLIELLVVVLIIGILSAVALPQYETAVLKSHYTQLQTVASAYKTAADAYYMANGEYPQYWDDMDLTPPAGCTAEKEKDNSYLYCNPKNTILDLYNSSEKNLVAFYRPNKQTKVAYVQWLDVSAHPGRRECWAVTSDQQAQKFCKSLNGTLLGETYHSYCSECTRYILP